MELYDKEAFISAISATRKPVAFLVGAPISTDNEGRGVPGVSSILDIIRSVIEEENPSALPRYDAAVSGKSGPVAYQMAMSWLQANIHQDAVNEVISRSVLQACIDKSSIGDFHVPNSDGSPEHWYIPPGVMGLTALTTCLDTKYHGPILTTNFDPLLSLALRKQGGRPSLKVLDTDGSLPREIENDSENRQIIHLHGYWRGSDTLHTVSQLKSPRPKLKASLQRILKNHTLVVTAYSGWDDIFTTALADLMHDDQVQLDVLWCFYEQNSLTVESEYKSLLDKVTPAITRGRFRGYGGIDCHTIFSDIGIAFGARVLSESPKSLALSPDTSLPDYTQDVKNEDENFVDRYFTNRLDEALETFSSQPKIWVDPIISPHPEKESDSDPSAKVDLSYIVSTPSSLVIKASPQFGLTCLGLHLVREAWRLPEPLYWLYIDAKIIKPTKNAIEKLVATETRLLSLKEDDIKCVVIDSWTDQEKDCFTLFQEVSSNFKNTKIVVLETLTENPFATAAGELNLDREFEIYHLWTLPRSHVRKVVADYNNVKHIGDEDTVTSKVVTDLEVLNIHRTPLNCLTILKVSEIDFDESPVNRSEMIKRVLFLLFNVDDVPTYKIRPDLKDSEFVLGYFCEKLIRQDKYYFTREYFLNELNQCCKERMIDLEVQVVFDVLSVNHIIIKIGDTFRFRFAYWVYYFAAQRIIHDTEFAKYIFENRRYANFPEIIEFYTGIDRRRDDALQVLIEDLRVSCKHVEKKCGLPDSWNPYKFGKWRPSTAALEHMKNEISDGVKSSNLPAAIKDEHADRSYDRTKPFDQEIRSILCDVSYATMVQTMKAGARALRNSDYVEPDTKRQLMAEITNCWSQISNVLISLAPLLAKRGRATFDDHNFTLVGNFGKTFEQRLPIILNELPGNVVNWYKDDLFSQKMGPLLYDRFNSEKLDLVKHELALLIIRQRPRGWRVQIQQYITSIQKDSFYLFDIYRTLRACYRYSFASPQNLSDMKYLIKMAIAKHETGSKMPTVNVINGPRFRNAIPNREVGDDI